MQRHALALAALIAVSAVKLAIAAGAIWQSVAIGGGGYVSGIVVTASSAGTPTVFFRTDVGGCYMSNTQRTAWRPLTDNFTYSQRNLYGQAALAVSGGAAPRLYMAAGAYLDQSPSGIYVSPPLPNPDVPFAWTQLTPPSWPVRLGGNDYTHTQRAAGERLAVSSDGRTLLFGSELDGMWRSGDSGASWQQVACKYVPCDNTTDAEFGVNLVAFDPSPAAGGKIVIASLYGVGMLISTDAGASWTEAKPGGPTRVNRCAWRPGAARSTVTPLLCAGADGLWIADGGFNWKQLTQGNPLPPTTVYFGVDVSPHDPSSNTMVALAYADSGPFHLLLSSNGGASWAAVTAVSSNMLPWDQWNMTDLTKASAAANVKFDPDPARPHAVWVANWYSMWLCDDISPALPTNAAHTTHTTHTETTEVANNTTDTHSAAAMSGGNDSAGGVTYWHNVMPGHEEVFVLSATMPPVGPLLMLGTADLGGFQYPATTTTTIPAAASADCGDGGAAGPLSSYPPLCYAYTDGGEGTGSDYTALVIPGPPPNTTMLVPAAMVRSQYVPWNTAGGPNGTGIVSVSTDGGASWKATAFPGARIPLRVAVAAFYPNSIIALIEQGTPMCTSDGGDTWTDVIGLPPFNYVPLSGNRYNHSYPLTSVRTLAPKAAEAEAEAVQQQGNETTFMYYDCGTGTTYASVGNTACTFAAVSSGTGTGTGTGTPGPTSPRCQLLSIPLPANAPGAGELWLAAGSAGLYTSSNGGVSWSAVGSVSEAHNIAFGAGRSARDPPVLYMWGTLAGSSSSGSSDYTVYASIGPAYGASWISLADATGKGLGDWAEVLSASLRVPEGFGVVVLGSFGRGAFYTNASALLP